MWQICHVPLVASGWANRNGMKQGTKTFARYPTARAVVISAETLPKPWPLGHAKRSC